MGEAKRNHERSMLLHHGTELIALKPQNVVEAARADISRMYGIAAEAGDNQRDYAFYLPDVRSCEGLPVSEGLEHLLDLAVARGAFPPIKARADDSMPPDPIPYNTRYLYRHPDLLRAALELLKVEA